MENDALAVRLKAGVKKAFVKGGASAKPDLIEKICDEVVAVFYEEVCSMNE